MNEPLISIIVPAYNAGGFIEACIESLTAQTYKNIEIIAVNDGSTDDTEAILKRMAETDNRIKVYCKKNGGVSSARNYALSKAKGEYISFSDSDDTNEPDKLEYLYGLINEYKVPIAHCGYNSVKGDTVTPVTGTGKIYVQSKYEALKCIAGGSLFTGGLWNKLIRKDMLDGIMFNESLIENEDILVCFQAFMNADKSVFADVPKYNYIYRATSACRTMKRHKSSEDYVTVAKTMIKSSENTPVYEVALSRYVAGLLRLFRYQNKTQTADTRAELERLLKDNKIRSSKYALSAKMICVVPHIYKFLYSLYDKIRKPNNDI